MGTLGVRLEYILNGTLVYCSFTSSINLVAVGSSQSTNRQVFGRWEEIVKPGGIPHGEQFKIKPGSVEL